MADFSGKVLQSFASAGIDVGELRRAQRIAWIRNLWRTLVEQAILDHTNAVYIFEKDGQREMHVYMDDSLFASEVSNRKALIYEECRQKYNEPIDDFFVHVSSGSRKNNYPFREIAETKADQNDPVPLNEEEMAMVDNACKAIPDEKLKARFRQAMISDLEWKKGNK